MNTSPIPSRTTRREQKKADGGGFLDVTEQRNSREDRSRFHQVFVVDLIQLHEMKVGIFKVAFTAAITDLGRCPQSGAFMSQVMIDSVSASVCPPRGILICPAVAALG